MKKSLVCAFVILMITSAYSQIQENVNSLKHFQDTVFQSNLHDLKKEAVLNDPERILSTTHRDKNGYRVVEELWQGWDGSNWLNNRKYIYSYNSDDLLLERIMEFWIDNQWTIMGRLLYSYNNDGNVTEIVEEAYIDGEWDNSSLFSHFYDNNGLMTEKRYQYWINSDWVNDHRFLFVYDGENCIEESYEFWESEQWNYNYKILSTFNENNYLVEIINLNWENIEWLNNSKYTYTYDNENLLQEKLIELWYNDNWIVSSRNLYSYDENLNLIENLRQILTTTNWEDQSINSFDYDENQNQIEWMYQSYNSSGELRNFFRYTNTFDENDNEIIKIREDWEDEQWVNDDRRIFSYENFTELTEFILAEIPMTNFPNPFNPTTSIEFSIQLDSNINLSIFNIKGQKIKTLANNEFNSGHHSIIWNGDDENNKPVSSSVYFYRLNVNGKTESVKKCLLLK